MLHGSAEIQTRQALQTEDPCNARSFTSRSAGLYFAAVEQRHEVVAADLCSSFWLLRPQPLDDYASFAYKAHAGLSYLYLFDAEGRELIWNSDAGAASRFGGQAPCWWYSYRIQWVALACFPAAVRHDKRRLYYLPRWAWRGHNLCMDAGRPPSWKPQRTRGKEAFGRGDACTVLHTATP